MATDNLFFLSFIVLEIKQEEGTEAVMVFFLILTTSCWQHKAEQKHQHEDYKHKHSDQESFYYHQLQ